MKNDRIGIKQATKKGYIECCVPGVADFAYPDSKLRRGRVQGGGWTIPYTYGRRTNSLQDYKDKE